MSETPTWPESICPSQEELAIARNEIYSILEGKPIWNSITFDPDIKQIFGNNLNKENLIGKDIHEKYKGAHFLYSEHEHHGWNRLDMQWLDDAIELLAKNNKEKILLIWWISPELLKNGKSLSQKSDKMKLFLTYPNTEFKQLPINVEELFSDSSENENISNQAIIDSLTFVWFNEVKESIQTNLIESLKSIKQEFDERYLNATVIMSKHKDEWWNFSDFKWIDQAVELLARDPMKTIILFSWMPLEYLEKNVSNFNLFLNYKHTEYHRLPKNLSECLIKKDSTSVKKIKNDVKVNLVWEEAAQRIWTLRHALKHKDDPYDKTESEKTNWLNEVQKFFPWLETFDKAMDYILHIKLDLPEPMKWKRIQWVYVDVDGTLIEYVGIHSGKEGTQKLRQKVVDLLIKYESEWKEIIVWTGWDVDLKKKYLRSLWITRPVVSKYDYAGATAEIVLDDKDQNAFIAQSKIYPETYINTVAMQND